MERNSLILEFKQLEQGETITTVQSVLQIVQGGEVPKLFLTGIQNPRVLGKTSRFYNLSTTIRRVDIFS